MPHRRQRKFCDVLDQMPDARGVLREFVREKPRHDRSAMIVKNALAYHAQAAQPHALVIDRAIQNFRDDFPELRDHRAHPFLDERIQRLRRLDHFARHQFAMP